jgi:hypothetical protein
MIRNTLYPGLEFEALEMCEIDYIEEE